MVEDRGIPPRSPGCRPGVSCSVTDPPNGTPARTFTRIFDVRSVALCFKLRGHKVDARLGLPPSKIDFADRRFGSLPCERNFAVSRSCAYRDHEGHLFYRQRPRCYGTITAWLRGSELHRQSRAYETLRRCLSPHFEIGADSPSHTDIGDLQDRFSTLRVPALNW